MGVEQVDSSSKKPVFKNYWPGSNNVSVDTNHPVKAFVADNPNQLFMVAADGTSTDRATALTNIFANVSLASAMWFNKHWSFYCRDGHLYSCNDSDIIHACSRLNRRRSESGLHAAGVNYVVRFNFHHNAPASSSDSQTTAASTGI